MDNAPRKRARGNKAGQLVLHIWVEVVPQEAGRWRETDSGRGLGWHVCPLAALAGTRQWVQIVSAELASMVGKDTSPGEGIIMFWLH